MLDLAGPLLYTRIQFDSHCEIHLYTLYMYEMHSIRWRRVSVCVLQNIILGPHFSAYLTGEDSGDCVFIRLSG